MSATRIGASVGGASVGGTSVATGAGGFVGTGALVGAAAGGAAQAPSRVTIVTTNKNLIGLFILILLRK